MAGNPQRVDCPYCGKNFLLLRRRHAKQEHRSIKDDVAMLVSTRCGIVNGRDLYATEGEPVNCKVCLRLLEKDKMLGIKF